MKVRLDFELTVVAWIIFYRKTPAWIWHRDVRVYTVNTPRLQVYDNAAVRVGPIESGKSVFFYYWSHMDFYGVGTVCNAV